MNPVMNQYKMSSPAERARLRVVYALLGTVFFMPVNLIAMEICLALAVVFAVCSGWKYGFGPAPSFPCSCRRQAFALRPCCPSSARLTG